MASGVGTGRDRSASASGMFGVTRSASGRSRSRSDADRVALEEQLAVAGDQHRIDDQRAQPVLGDGRGDRFDHGRRAQHPGLGGRHPAVADHGVDLGPTSAGGQDEHVMDAERVLGRHCR